MMQNDMELLLEFYSLIAIGISISMASTLERRLKARLPQTRPYKWGFYLGCMGIAWAPLALLCFICIPLSLPSVRDSEDSKRLIAIVFCLFWSLTNTLWGFYIIKRKRWAWIVGTVLTGPLGWIINGIYASNRWQEFRKECGSSPSSAVTHSGADSPAPPPLLPPPLPKDASGNGVFFLAVRGQRQGPYSLGQLRTMWSSGQVSADALYWQQGMTAWYPLIGLLERAQ